MRRTTYDRFVYKQLGLEVLYDLMHRLSGTPETNVNCDDEAYEALLHIVHKISDGI